MSNGVFDEVKEIIETEVIPQRVSNRLLAALVIESFKQGKKNAEDIRVLQLSEKRWRSVAIGLGAVATFFGLDIGGK